MKYFHILEYRHKQQTQLLDLQFDSVHEMFKVVAECKSGWDWFRMRSIEMPAA